MSNQNLFLTALGIFLIIAVIRGIRYLRGRRQRRDALSELAASLGLSFMPNSHVTLVGQPADFNLFNYGSSRSVENCLSGSVQDLSVSLFQYSYYLGRDDDTVRRDVAVACVWLPRELPQFRLTPTTFFHKVGSVLGYSDINFDSHPKFSREYHLSGKDETAIRQLFTPDALDFAESQPGLNVEGCGSRFILYRGGLLGAENARDMLTTAMRLAELFRA